MMVGCEPELAGLTNQSRSPVISVSGYGETRPVDTDHRDADANRRIDLRFLMEPPKSAAGAVDPATVPVLPPVEDTRRELSE
jgi:hypothetical protein